MGGGLFQLRTHLLHSITVGNQGWSRGQGPGSKNWSKSHGGMLLTSLLLMTCSACFILASRTASPVVASPTASWAFDNNHQSRKYPIGLPYRSIWWQHFISWGCLFPNDYLVLHWHKTSTTNDDTIDVNSILLSVSVTFLRAVTKNLRKQLKEGMGYLGSWFELIHYGREGVMAEMWGSWSRYVWKQEAEINADVLLAFTFFPCNSFLDFRPRDGAAHIQAESSLLD